MDRKAEITQPAVDRAAERLLASGIRPTVQRVHEQLGGPPRKLRPMVEDWWKRLSSQLRSDQESVPPDATVEERAELVVRQAIDSARFSLRDRIKAAKRTLVPARGAAAAPFAGGANVLVAQKDFERIERELNELHSLVLDHLQGLANARSGFATVEKRLADLYGDLRLAAAAPRSSKPRPAKR
jgi:hypothetical protein